MSRARGAMKGRVPAAIAMGPILLLLFALIRAAASSPDASSLGLWASEAAAVVVIAVAAFGARTPRSAWRRMCLMNGLASLLVVAAISARAVAASGGQPETGQAFPPEFSRPFGAALGFAISAGFLGMAAVVLAVLFFAAAFLLGHRKTQNQHPA